jgi:hypothetical protein
MVQQKKEEKPIPDFSSYKLYPYSNLLPAKASSTSVWKI